MLHQVAPLHWKITAVQQAKLHSTWTNAKNGCYVVCISWIQLPTFTECECTCFSCPLITRDFFVNPAVLPIKVAGYRVERRTLEESLCLQPLFYYLPLFSVFTFSKNNKTKHTFFGFRIKLDQIVTLEREKL